ncbi:MAG: ribonuclease E/G [Parvularculaceae bacterium]|nr:ribonuclease E/G [Parvularculaceae bacterium]
MKPVLLIECGAAETIGALTLAGEIVKLFFAPARGDELAPRAPGHGDIVLGRIKKSAPALGGAFVDIGSNEEAFLPAKSGAALHEGASAIFRVVRPALGGKGAILDADWRNALPEALAAALAKTEGAPRLLSLGADSAVMIAVWAQPFGSASIVVNRAETKAALAASGISSVVDEGVGDAPDIEEAIAQSLELEAPIGDGAHMGFAETAGGVVVDIDAGGASNAARKPNDRVNERAAQRLFRELSRRSVGGRVFVDFLPPSSAAARQRLLGALRSQDIAIYERRLGKLAPDGVLDLTAPRRDLSMLERATEWFGDEAIVAGRRLTLDWTAKRAVAAIEGRLRRQPRQRIRLDAGDDLLEYLEQKQQWRTRLIDRYGARLEFRRQQRLPPRRFDVAEN